MIKTRGKKMKDIKDMSKKELIEELNAVEQHIELFAYGRYELNYREQLLMELGRRGVELEKTTIYRAVKK